jgi:hypothetical protein
MRKYYLTLVVLLLATAMAPAQGWAEKMFKDGVKHDFGTVPRGAQLRHTFKITNIYNVKMQITSIKSGCGCVTIDPKYTQVLEPTKSTKIEVRMDARRFTGPKTVTIRVTVGPEFISSAELKLTANSRADVVFNPGEVNFGTVSRGQTPTQTIDVEYAGALNWQVSEVIAKDVPFTTSIKELYRKTATTGDKVVNQVGYRLSVTLKATASVGSLKHDLYLKTNDPASPLVAVLAEANVQSALSVSPSTLSLGTVKAGVDLTRRVVVRGARAFKVTGVEGIGNGIELGGTLAASETEVQFVTFKCTFDKPGPFRRELKIKTNLQDAPVQVVIEGTAEK